MHFFFGLPFFSISLYSFFTYFFKIISLLFLSSTSHVCKQYLQKPFKLIVRSTYAIVYIYTAIFINFLVFILYFKFLIQYFGIDTRCDYQIYILVSLTCLGQSRGVSSLIETRRCKQLGVYFNKLLYY